MAWMGLFLIAGYYLKTIFSVPPFIEQEAAIQAYWWISDPRSFAFKLFDPAMNDGGPGRFRFFEYLFTAGYWKLNDFGLLPHDLYDYAAIAINLGIGVSIFLFARRAKLARLYQFFLPAVFLLSCQAFHTSVWHYRRAKLLVTIFLVAYVWLLKSESSRRRSVALVVLTMLSIVTDPYLILLVPILVIATEGFRALTPAIKSVLLGYGLGALLIILLNGIIGPRFNPSCTLIPSAISDPTGTLLTFRNTFRFYDILPDLGGPTWNDRASLFFNFWLIALTGFYTYCVWRLKSRIGTAFLCSLPVVAFLVKPDSDQVNFSGYYGHCLLVLWLFSIAEMLENRGDSPPLRAFLVGAFSLTILFHQIGAEDAYLIWRMGHLGKQNTAQKFWRDYSELKAIDAHLKAKNPLPYELKLDRSNFKQFKMEAIYEKHDRGTERERTSLGYLFIPALFKKEVAEGKILIRNY